MTNLVLFYFASRIILRAQNVAWQSLTSLFAAVSSNSVSIFDDGNKSRIISNRDQKKGQIPSGIMVRLTIALRRYRCSRGQRTRRRGRRSSRRDSRRGASGGLARLPRCIGGRMPSCSPSGARGCVGARTMRKGRLGRHAYRRAPIRRWSPHAALVRGSQNQTLWNISSQAVALTPA